MAVGEFTTFPIPWQDQEELVRLATIDDQATTEFLVFENGVEHALDLQVLVPEIETPRDYRHVQGVGAQTWNVRHNRNTIDIRDLNIFVQGRPVFANWSIVDPDTITVTFDSAQSGTAIVEFLNV